MGCPVERLASRRRVEAHPLAGRVGRCRTTGDSRPTKRRSCPGDSPPARARPMRLTPFLPSAEKDRLMRPREVHEPRDFSKRGDALPVPNLVEVQQVSYLRFLQKDVPIEKRKDDGLESLL